MMPPATRIAILVLCAGASLGFGITSIAGVLDHLRQAFDLGLLGSQCLVFVLVGGCFVGAALAGPVTRRWGRRPTIALAVLLAVMASAVLLTQPPLSIVFATRALIGLSIGLLSMAVPMYAAEASHASLRGTAVTLFQLAITGGILLAYGLALLFDGATQWHWVLGGGLVPNLAAGIALIVLPESPLWLAGRGRTAQASAAAKMLGIPEQWGALDPRPATGAATPERGGIGQALGQGRVLSVLLLCSFLFVLQNLSGIDGILYYAPEIFKSLGFSAGAASLGATCGLGLANFLATIASVVLVDRAGRRQLWIWGSALMAAGLATVVAAAQHDWPWLGLAGLCVYILAFAVSLGPLPYVLMSELVPSVLREPGIATASAVSWLFNALIALVFLSVVQILGLAGTMLIFLAVCLVSFCVGLWWLPETRRVPLDVIEARVLAGHPLRELGVSNERPVFRTEE
ncbi:MAG TPA: sugar porter family MFS transporter [Paraburkholderia sp.]|nr:sugar porter family MFS transporter [Paraburkholderia sp.]